MWFRTENERKATNQNYFLEYRVVAPDGSEMIARRLAQSQAEAKRTAELFSTIFNQDIVVYGKDSVGEFVFGVASLADRAAAAETQIVRDMYAASVEQSLKLGDQLLEQFEPEHVKAFASLAAGIGSIAQASRRAGAKDERSTISYSLLFQTVLQCQREPEVLSIPWNVTDLALLSERVFKEPLVVDMNMAFGADGQASTVHAVLEVYPDVRSLGLKPKRTLTRHRPAPIAYTLDEKQTVIRPRTMLRGKMTLQMPAQAPQDTEFLILLETSEPYSNAVSGAALLAEPEFINSAFALIQDILKKLSLTKNRLSVINPPIVKIYSQPPKNQAWTDLVPNAKLKAELDLVVSSVEQRDALKAKGLGLKRGLLISGFPGVGKSASINAFIHALLGSATIFIVESVGEMRQVYTMAMLYAPSVVIFEDLDLITINRREWNAPQSTATAELLSVLSGVAEFPDVITIATTNFPEKIDEALSKRPGRFDTHIRVEPPTIGERLAILDLYLEKLEVPEFTRAGVRRLFQQEFGNHHLVGAHIEEFVKVGVKRQMLKDGPPSHSDFEAGVEAIKSVANQRSKS